jgi:threonine/homoserine/homoserine lactone efflux protein
MPVELATLAAFAVTAAAIAVSPGPDTIAGVGRTCRDAILCNVLNPKVMVLFLALYPNFPAIGRGDVTAQVATLSAVLIAINAAWQVALVCAAEFARRWLTRPEVQRAVGRLTGGILIALAAIMLWGARSLKESTPRMTGGQEAGIADPLPLRTGGHVARRSPSD